ncbi:MAG: FecR family protein [Syntrophomonadaceae bacterium]|nr:FecR family protein [Syntrophomonadaceae bacterium]
MKKLLIAVLLAVFVLASGGGAALAAKDNTAATLRLEKTDGEAVSVSSANGADVSILEGMKLYSGHQVTTGMASYAYLSLDDTKAAKMDANSKAQVRQSGKKLEVNLAAGEIFFNVSAPLKHDETLNIRTSTMVTGVRGTSGVVSVIDETTAEIYLLTGSVTVNYTDRSGTQRTATISAGQKAEVNVIQEEDGTESTEVTITDLTEDEVDGFAAVEVANDEALQQQITEQTELSVPVIIGDAEEKLSADQQADKEQQEQIEQDIKNDVVDEDIDPLFTEEPPSGGGGGGSSSPAVTRLYATPDGIPFSAVTQALQTGNVEVAIDNTTVESGLLFGEGDDAALEIPEGRTLTLEPGVRTTIAAGQSLTINGTVNNSGNIENDGTITNNSPNSFNHNDGAIYGSGSIVNTENGTMTISGQVAGSGSIINNGTMTISGTINAVPAEGALITNNAGGTLTIETGAIIGGEVLRAAIVNMGKMTMTGGEITATAEDVNAIGVFSDGGSFTMSGASKISATGEGTTTNDLTGTTGVYGVFNKSGTFTMGVADAGDDAPTITATATAAEEQGFAIGVENKEGGTFTMGGQSAIIAEASGSDGVAYGVHNDGSFNMNGGAIEATTAGETAFGVRNFTNGTLTMNGGNIKATAEGGAAVGVDNRHTFTMNNTSAVTATAANGNALGVFNMRANNAAGNGGVFTMNDTSSVTATGSGSEWFYSDLHILGVYGVYNGSQDNDPATATFTMTGGAIKATATATAGVASAHGVCSSATFIMEGGSIVSTTAATAESGTIYGVYSDSGIFTMKAGKITANAAAGPTVYGAWNGNTFTMNGGTIESSQYGVGNINSNGGTLTMNGGNIKASSTSGNAYGVHNQASFTMTGDTNTITAEGATGATGVRNHNEGDGANAEFTMNGGNITATATATASGTATGVENLDKFTMTGNSSVTAAATDENAVGVHNHNEEANAEFIMESGTITATATAADKTAYGVYSYNGTFTMEKGTIEATATAEGGAAYGVWNTSTFTTNSNSTITATAEGTTGSSYGVDNYGTFSMNGGEIHSATNGITVASAQGVRSSNGTFTMNKGTVTATAKNGQAVGVNNNVGNFIMNDGAIKATTEGGSAHGVYNSGTSTMTGGTIESSQGGVYISIGSTFTMTRAEGATSSGTVISNATGGSHSVILVSSDTSGTGTFNFTAGTLISYSHNEDTETLGAFCTHVDDTIDAVFTPCDDTDHVSGLTPQPHPDTDNPVYYYITKSAPGP